MVHRGSREPKKEAFWWQTIRGRPSSGMSIRAWCRRHALREASYYWWRARLAQRDTQASALVPVRVTADSSVTDAFDLSTVNGAQGRIEIVLPSPRRVRLIGPVDRQALSDVLTRFAATPIDRIDAFLPDRWAKAALPTTETEAASA